MPPFDIVQQRLRNQYLMASPWARPEQIVHWFGAVQSQEYLSATWGIAQRSEQLTQAAIDQAFGEGALLRTHAMRPTWHFVTPADIRWLLMLTSPRVHALNATYYRKCELDPQTLVRGATVLTNALQGKQLTRNELSAALEQAGIIRATDDRLRQTYLVMYAELEGLICSGALRGKQHTYALLDERVPAAPTLTREEALAELVRRYFTSHGPATIKDFTWWSGLTTSDARAGLELNRAVLESVKLNGQVYWFGQQPEITPPAAPQAHLLPAYDEYTVAYKDHRAILAEEYRGLVIAAFGIVIVINGQIVGAWKRVFERAHVLLTLERFRALTDDEEQALAVIIKRYQAFLGKPIVLA